MSPYTNTHKLKRIDENASKAMAAMLRKREANFGFETRIALDAYKVAIEMEKRRDQLIEEMESSEKLPVGVQKDMFGD